MRWNKPYLTCQDTDPNPIGPPPRRTRRCLSRHRDDAGSGRAAGEKTAQRLVGFVGGFLRNEVAALYRVAPNRFGVLTPDPKHIVTAALRASAAPQHQQRHRQPPAAVGAVVVEINRSAGAIFGAGS